MNKYTIIQSSKLDTYAISVIVPVYNVEEFLKECLDSIVQQTFQNIEIVCVNDGSTDSSFDIVKEYALKDDRFTVVDQKNQGISATRNHGLSVAKGEYIYFLDSDDIISKEAMELAYHAAKAEDVDVLYFDAICFGDPELVRMYQPFFQSAYEYPSVVKGSKLFAMRENNKDFKASVCLQLVKKEYLVKNQLYFHEGVIHEDQSYTALVMLLANKVVNIKESLYYRRYREGSIMTAPKTFNHVYGYYVAAKDVMGCETMFEGLTNEEHEAVNHFINRILDRSRTVFTRINNQELSKYKSLSFSEQLDFELLVITPGRLMKELKEAKRKFYHKLGVYHWLKNRLSKDQIKRLRKLIKK